MVKMIIELPSHIDGEKFIELTMDVIKGRFGKDSYYNGVKPYASVIMRPEKVSTVFEKGYAGKNGVKYYEIDAEELDPVIIATLEEIGAYVGMKYNFVTEGSFINREWWYPCEAELDFHKKDNTSLDAARDEYETMLLLLSDKAYYDDAGQLYKMA